MKSAIQAFKSLARNLRAGKLLVQDLPPAILHSGLTEIPPTAAQEIHAQIIRSPRLAHALACVALELARQSSDARLRAQVLFLYIRALNTLGEFRDASAQCERAAQQFLDLDDFDGAARVWLEAAWAQSYLGNLDAVRSLLVQARALSPNGDPLLDARNIWIEGRIWRDQGDYDQAALLFEKARDLLRAAGETYDAARCQRELGHTCSRRAPIKALSLLEDVRAIFEQARCPTEVALCNYYLGQCWHDRNQFQNALKHLTAAQKLFRKHQMNFFIACCTLDQGIVQWRLNNFDVALQQLYQARAVFVQCGAEAEVSACDINIGCVLFDQNGYDEAIARFEHAAQRATVEGRRKKAARCYANIGLAFDQQGRYAAALTYFQRARDEFASQQLVYEMASLCDLHIGRTLVNLGDYSRALGALEQARTVFREQELLADLAECEMYRARAFFAMGQNANALNAIASARTLFARTQQPVYIAYCDRLLIDARRNTIGKAEALERLTNSRDVFVKHGQPIDAALCDLTRGRVHLAWREWNAARRYLKRARRVLYPSFPDQAWRADYALGTAARGEKQEQLALQHYLDAVGAITKVRAGLGLEQISNQLFGTREHVFADALQLARRARAHDQALGVLEAAKGQTVLTYLARPEWRVRERSGAGAEWAPFVERERKLRYELNALRRTTFLDDAQRDGEQLHRTTKHVATQRLNDLNALSEEYEALVARLRLAQRGLEGVPSVAPFSLESFRRVACTRWGARWVALDYYLAANQLTIVSIDPDGIQMDTLRLSDKDQHVLDSCTDTRADIRKLIYNGFGGNSSTPVTSKYLRQLTAQLIPDSIRARRDELTLIIVPHGKLHHMPFHALMEGELYLADRFSFMYTPSLQVLTQLHEGTRASNDPSTMLLCGLDEFGGRAHPLKHASREMSALQASGNAHVTAWWKTEATRAKLLEWSESSKLEEFDVLHFVTHAIVEPHSPHSSRLLLADDALTVLDVMDLNLRARLVSLSACSSALSEGGRGDELLGLAQAFFYAGAHALVASLWAVEDESTAQVMTCFYENLSRGDSISKALTAAQRELRRAGFSPFYWAPFVAIGNA